MLIEPTAIPEVRVIVPRRFPDARGFFTETYSRRRFLEHGLDFDFVQDNLSFSLKRGVVRGLHFQRPPAAQDKLVSVLRGSVLDVAVDLRRGSPTLGRHVAVTLSAEAGNQLLVPAGFAHGFCTLEPDTVVAYKVTAFYAPEHDTGLYWADPALGIGWPVSEDEAELSDKDRLLPRLAEVAGCFAYIR